MAEGYLEPVWCQVGECEKEMHASILKPRHDLEQQSIEGLTAALVESMIMILSCMLFSVLYHLMTVLY